VPRQDDWWEGQVRMTPMPRLMSSFRGVKRGGLRRLRRRCSNSSHELKSVSPSTVPRKHEQGCFGCLAGSCIIARVTFSDGVVCSISNHVRVWRRKRPQRPYHGRGSWRIWVKQCQGLPFVIFWRIPDRSWYDSLWEALSGKDDCKLAAQGIDQRRTNGGL